MAIAQLQFNLSDPPESRNLETVHKNPDVIVVQKLSKESDYQSKVFEDHVDSIENLSYIDKNHLEAAITLAKRDMRNKKMEQMIKDTCTANEKDTYVNNRKKSSKQSSVKNLNRLSDIYMQTSSKTSKARVIKSQSSKNSRRTVTTSSNSPVSEPLQHSGMGDGSSVNEDSESHSKVDKVLDELARLHYLLDQQLDEIEASVKRALHKINVHEALPTPKDFGVLGKDEDHARRRLRMDEQMIRSTRTRYFLQRQTHNIDRDWSSTLRSGNVMNAEKCKVASRLIVVFREALHCAATHLTAIHNIAVSDGALLETDDLLAMFSHMIKLRRRVDSSESCRSHVVESQATIDAIGDLSETLQLRIKALTAPKKKRRKTTTNKSLKSLLKTNHTLNNILAAKTKGTPMPKTERLAAQFLQRYLEGKFGCEKRDQSGHPGGLEKEPPTITRHDCRPSSSVPATTLSSIQHRSTQHPRLSSKTSNLFKKAAVAAELPVGIPKSRSLTDVGRTESSQLSLPTKEIKTKPRLAMKNRSTNTTSRNAATNVASEVRQLRLLENAAEETQTSLNEPILDSMLQLLDRMQSEQDEIRAKWNSVSFAIANGDGYHITHNESDMDEPTAVVLKPESNNFPSPSSCGSAAMLHPDDHELFVPKFHDQSNFNPTTLKLLEETKSAILEYVEQYRTYLHRKSDNLSDHFDPWSFVQRLCDEILNDCIDEVATEVDDLNGDIVEHVYTSEFTLPLDASTTPA